MWAALVREKKASTTGAYPCYSLNIPNRINNLWHTRRILTAQLASVKQKLCKFVPAYPADEIRGVPQRDNLADS